MLYMRQAKKSTQLSEWGMSFYNNLLCCGVMAFAAVATGEFRSVSSGDEGWSSFYVPD